MRIKLFVIILFFIFSVIPVLAGDAPTLTSPSNNSTTASSRLDWQTPTYQLYSSNPYRVQDDDSSFSSINKDYYTSNTHYAPTLSQGSWFWRVKAKDVSGIWSSWSESWTFILANSTPIPTPTSIPTPTPTPPPPTPSPTTPSNSSSFTISNVPSQINSDSSFSTSINLSLPSNPSSSFYLKGAFKKSDGSNYFGQTLVSNNWVKNGSSYSSQYSITTDSSGNWSGNLRVQPDSEDSGFTGSGDYIFKVARYTSLGSGPTWSNESSINIIQPNVSTNGDTTDHQTTTNNSSNLGSSTPLPTYLPKPTHTKSASAAQLNYQIASIAAAATSSAEPSPKVEVKSQKQINPFLLIGTLLMFASVSLLGYIYFSKKNR